MPGGLIFIILILCVIGAEAGRRESLSQGFNPPVAWLTGLFVGIFNFGLGVGVYYLLEALND